MNPLDKTIDALRELGCNPRETSGGWQARCPAHDDSNPSLSVSRGQDGRALIRCFAGCDTPDVVQALGLKESDLFARDDSAQRNGRASRPAKRAGPPPPNREGLGTLARECHKRLTDEARAELASALGVAPHALRALRFGQMEDGTFTWPEHNGGGEVVGVGTRDGEGAKKCVGGSKRGLILDGDARDSDAPLIVCEGASDTAAALTLGLRAVGLAQAGGSRDALAWRGEDVKREAPPGVVVIADADSAGERGAQKVARHMAARVRCPVRLAATPKGAADLRVMLSDAREQGLSLDDGEALERAGAEALDELQRAPVVEAEDDDDDRVPFPADEAFGPAGDLRELASRVSEATQTPYEASAVLMMSTISACLQRKARADLNAWYEEPPIWSAVLLESGNRKSELLRILRKPVVAAQRAEDGALAPDRARVESQREVLGAKLKKQQRAAVDGKGTVDDVTATRLQLDELEDPTSPKTILTDATPEAAAAMMGGNGERLFVSAAEGDVLGILLGLYGGGKSTFGVVLGEDLVDPSPEFG